MYVATTGSRVSSTSSSSDEWHPLEAGRAERAADPGAELSGGLGRERETEDLVRRHLLGRDEVDDPGRHDRGLARPRAGDDHRRFEGGGHGGPLLRGERVVGSHQGLKLCGCHDSTVPEWWAGHMTTKSQWPHWSPGRAGNSSSRNRATAAELPLDRAHAVLVGLLRVLALHLQDAPHVLAELPQLGATVLGGGRQRLDGAVLDGQLVEPELGVRGDLVVGRRVLAGLEVDDDDAAVGVELEPVGVAVELDLGAVRELHQRIEPLLRREEPTRVRPLTPGDETLQGLAQLVPLALPGPRRAERHLPPDPVYVRHQLVDLGEVGNGPPSSSWRPKRSAIAWATLPKPCACVDARSARASEVRNHWAGQVSSEVRVLAEIRTGSPGVRSGSSERDGARSPHHDAGSAAGTHASPARWASVSIASRRAAARRSPSSWLSSAHVRRRSATSPSSDSGRSGRLE